MYRAYIKEVRARGLRDFLRQCEEICMKLGWGSVTPDLVIAELKQRGVVMTLEQIVTELNLLLPLRLRGQPPPRRLARGDPNTLTNRVKIILHLLGPERPERRPISSHTPRTRPQYGTLAARSRLI